MLCNELYSLALLDLNNYRSLVTLEQWRIDFICFRKLIRVRRMTEQRCFHSNRLFEIPSLLEIHFLSVMLGPNISLELSERPRGLRQLI